MQADTLIAFLIATAVVTIVPGPNILLIIHESIQKTTLHGLKAALGVTAGMVPLFLLSLAGISSLLIKWPWLFHLIRFAGMGYLIYLGVSIIRSASDLPGSAMNPSQTNRNSFLRGFLTCISNPKGLIFAGAFFPQFLDPHLPVMPQVTLLCGSCLAVATLIGCGYALSAGIVRSGLQSTLFIKVSSLLSGSVLILFGISLVFADMG